jgi:hypothetical protein
VSTILMCDAVLSEMEKSMVLVYKLQSVTADFMPFENDEVYSLVQMVLHTRPEFKAARFFSIKRSTMFSILYSMTTFLLVMLQFKSN